MDEIESPHSKGLYIASVCTKGFIFFQLNFFFTILNGIGGWLILRKQNIFLNSSALFCAKIQKEKKIRLHIFRYGVFKKSTKSECVCVCVCVYVCVRERDRE